VALCELHSPAASLRVALCEFGHSDFAN